MSKPVKFISVIIALTVLALAVATPARAFGSREGDKVVIGVDEVINDDLYIFAEEVVLEGTINGDLVVFGNVITINGTVNGDLLAAGRTIVINGEVSDDARIAGQVLFIGEEAKIGSDVIAAGYSLETRKGSVIAQDLVYAGGQVLLAGDVTRNVQVGTGAMELRGSVGGDVAAGVGEGEGNPPMSFPIQSTVPVPLVAPGLTIDPAAHIGGNLEYTQTNELTFPSGIVGGKVTRTEPQIDPEMHAVEQTSAEKVTDWALGLLRLAVTLILFGLFLGWLFPKFMKTLPENLQAKPWSSLGWGAVAFSLFWFALLAIFLIMVLGGIFFGVFTLGAVSGTIIWVGIFTLIAMMTGFVLVTSYLTKIVVGEWIGRWILNRISPDANHKFWPMVLGVFIVVAVVGLLNFPLIPLGFFGWLVNFAVILFGLGALWLWGREKFAKQPAAE